jgi:hypothetical protein
MVVVVGGGGGGGSGGVVCVWMDDNSTTVDLLVWGGRCLLLVAGMVVPVPVCQSAASTVCVCVGCSMPFGHKGVERHHYLPNS